MRAFALLSTAASSVIIDQRDLTLFHTLSSFSCHCQQWMTSMPAPCPSQRMRTFFANRWVTLHVKRETNVHCDSLVSNLEFATGLRWNRYKKIVHNGTSACFTMNSRYHDVGRLFVFVVFNFSHQKDSYAFLPREELLRSLVRPRCVYFNSFQ